MSPIQDSKAAKVALADAIISGKWPARPALDRAIYRLHWGMTEKAA